MATRTLKGMVQDFHRDCPDFEWISGKWFYQKKEFVNVDRFLLMNTNCRDVAEVERFKDLYMRLYGINDEWPELPIIEEAKQKGVVGPLAYPMNEKELMILHYLLEGKAGKAIFFYGVGGSGKSTICDIFCQIFGKENCCFTSLQDIGKFNIQLESARLWFDDDISPLWNDSRSSRFKPIVSNGNASFEAKGKTPHEGQYRCKCLFACNAPIKFDISDTGMLRRIVYYKKDVKIENPDTSLQNKKYSHDDLVNIVAAALEVEIDFGVFDEDTHMVIAESNSVWKYGMTGEYDNYVNRCDAAGYMPYGQEKWEEFRDIFREWFPPQEKKSNTLF